MVVRIWLDVGVYVTEFDSGNYSNYYKLCADSFDTCLFKI